MVLLQVNDVKKTYTTRFGGNQVQALKGVTFTVDQGEYVAIMGESGSGKTTLLNILAALDQPTGGTVLLDRQELSGIRDKQLAAFRRENLGFVFQEFNLLDTFSLKDNIVLPLVLSGVGVREMEERLAPIAEALGIKELLNKFPYEVSGGQKQRAAAARAVITNPKLILADEPTGALDSNSSNDLLKVFSKINESGQTILMVTHSVDAASHANRVLFIRDGVVFHQIYRGNDSNEQMYQKISHTLTMLRSGEVDTATRFMQSTVEIDTATRFMQSTVETDTATRFMQSTSETDTARDISQNKGKPAVASTKDHTISAGRGLD